MARKAKEPETEQKALTEQESNEDVLLVMSKESGYEKPKTLRQLEHIIENNAVRGAGYWRKAGTALLAIKTFRLWKQVKNPDKTQKYKSFVEYAEDRFGFKKTYAYDLAKAAARKPEAISETSARAEMKAERQAEPLSSAQAVERILRAWERFEESGGGFRDRAIADEAFVRDYDETLRLAGSAVRDLVQQYTPVPGVAVDVTPKREGEAA